MLKTYLFLMLATLFWSGNFVVARLIHNELHPFHLAFLRWAGVLIILLPFIYLHREKILKAIRSSFFIVFILGALGIGGFNTLLYYGLQDTTATNALLINSSVPIMIIFLSAIILKERLTHIQILGILLSTFGVIFLVVKGELSHLLELDLNRGDLFIVLSSLDWALYSVLLRFKPKNLTSLEFFSVAVIFGFLILSCLFLFIDVDTSINLLAMDTRAYFALSYIIIFPSLLSFFFWTKGIEAIGANKAGQFTHLMPIFGSFLAYLFLEEYLELYHLYGILFIGTGIYLSLFLNLKKTKLF